MYGTITNSRNEVQRAARDKAYATPLSEFHPGNPELFRSDTLWPYFERLRNGVQMLHHARNKYPWFEMQTLYPFDKTGVSTAVADAMAMRTVKSTLCLSRILLEA
jgi:hypothetical protein